VLPLLVVVTVKVGDDAGAMKVKSTWTVSPTAMEQPVCRVIPIDVVVTVPPSAPAWRQEGESITWMVPGMLPRATLDATVMLLPATRAEVALKNTSRVVELAAVVAVGESVGVPTAPVSEPIR
jgi:hypothetical protein